jgi:hypothetical protein
MAFGVNVLFLHNKLDKTYQAGHFHCKRILCPLIHHLQCIFGILNV